MVYFFECSDTSYTVFMGKDKFENEELLKYSFPEDIWFHVDKLSSAHVYLRLPFGSVDLKGVKSKAEAQTIFQNALDSIPDPVLQEMAQLVKANSIEGCKAAEVDIVYTPFLNLHKEERMDVGQVGFKDEHFRKFVKGVARDKAMVNKLEKTRREREVDFAREKEDYDEQVRRIRNKVKEELKQKAKAEEAARQAVAAEKSERARVFAEAASTVVRDQEDDDFA
mmetsp:Transcript_46387/g.92018  ORF Transcript_46387/g.92018 Transcript_46387/m.92018 type:complete len:224 (-) Transcript_46387:166-837(-)|eukprot:CAMPEP_0172824798 /NCGR_PEP_ID=MMETSP1075-20121228/18243_1 /TAXON_ID=2916 /ORGANISM="Ceratium fusus, Strain PA161109" /LENGTH=223 /DNA_ID=CAMNT_0013666137 /DNA_START=45 /DNA_END=716 /DNA_ORIENTATION=-